MDAVILMILLGATALILIGALVSLYRYLERKVLFPQLPRLWRGDRNRFLVFGALFPICAAGFVVYSFFTAATLPPGDQAEKPASPLDAYEQAPAQNPTPDWDSLRQQPETQITETLEPTPTEMTPQEQAAFDQGQQPSGQTATEQLRQDEAQALTAATPTEAMSALPATTPEPTPALTASPTLTQAPTPPATPTAKPTPAAAKQASAAAAPKGWAVCLASYPDQADAMEHTQRLTQKGMQAHTVEAQVKGGTWYRVCVTGFADIGQAKEALEQYKQQGLAQSPFPVRIR